MEYIKGYRYETEQGATNAIDAINAYFGIPVSNDAVTRTYTSYEQIGGFYVIRYLPELFDILGEPVDIEYEPIIIEL